MMTHLSKYIILLNVFWAFLCLPPVLAEDLVPAPYETALLEKINEARENPLAVAASLGMDPDTIIQDYPELRHVLTSGLLPLGFSDEIYQAARGHVDDMVTRQYYDYTSPEGESVKDRISAAGYNVSVSDELLGMLGFFNYVSAEQAVDRIFEDMFRSELAAETRNHKILNPAFRDAGAAMDAGVFQISSARANIYVAACDMAARPMWIFENEYLALVNQIRANPLGMAEVFGMDTDQLLEEHPEISDLLEDGVPPLVFNRQLYSSAVAHGRDMLDNAYLSKISKEDGRGVFDRVADTGYTVLQAGEVIGSVFGPATVSLKNLAFQIVANKFKEELAQDKDAPLTLLNPDFTHAGLCLLAKYVKNADTGESSKYLITVMDFGQTADAGDTGLWAMMYKDADGNGMYSLGEGLSGREVTVRGNGLDVKAYTDFVGRLVMPLPAGVYWMQTSDGNMEEVVGTFFELTETESVNNQQNTGVWLRETNEPEI